MAVKYEKNISLRCATFFLTAAGFWLASSSIVGRARNVIIAYTTFMLCFSIWVQLRCLYFSWGEFDECVFIMSVLLDLTVDLLKVVVLTVQKENFLGMIAFAQKNFWHSNYDKHETTIVAHTRRVCCFLVCIFSLFGQLTAGVYIIKPLISNIGKNASDRTLMYPMWLDIPESETPYFEILYSIQALALYQVGVSYVCFDNMFCILCLHIAAQFRILQYRMANMYNPVDNDTHVSSKRYSSFKEIFQQYETLAQFCITMEETFRIITLGQMLLSSMLICTGGYELAVVHMSSELLVYMAFFLLTAMCELWIVTYCCDHVTRESTNVSLAIYSAAWTTLPMDKIGKMARIDLQIVVLRSRRPCYLTACGFFIVSLETYTKIMGTAMSYFTLLRQKSVK